MSAEKVDALDPELAALLDAERRVDAPADAEARVFARLGRSIAAPPPGWRLGSPSAVAAVFALGVAAGVVGARASEPRISTVPVVPSASMPSSVAEQPTIAVPSLPVSAIPSLPVAPVTTSQTSSLSVERAILDMARTALVREDGVSSLAATEKHEKRFPQGLLSEEREALAIQALVLLRRFPEANARGARFGQRYPRSVFAPTVDGALRSIP